MAPASTGAIGTARRGTGAPTVVAAGPVTAGMAIRRTTLSPRCSTGTTAAALVLTTHTSPNAPRAGSPSCHDRAGGSPVDTERRARHRHAVRARLARVAMDPARCPPRTAAPAI